MKLLFIIGMHRSGTSVLTSYIETLGYNIGKNRNQDKDWQNPKGYWENNSFTHFHNNLLLKYNNIDWSNVNNKDLKYTKNHVKEYSNLIKKEFESEKIVIKDPRLSFFVDFLLDVSKELQADIKFIFATRNKEECTISLNKAQNLNLEACKKLFDISMSCYRDNMLKICYNDFLQNNLLCREKICLYLEEEDSNINKIDLNLYRNKFL
jgi:hypothetical protein